MKIRLLPSSFTQPTQFQSLTSLLINDDLLIDAGSAGFALGKEEISRIRHIFISHAHMDHIASLPGLLDACLGMGVQPPEIWANAHTIQMLRQMIFNNQVWPDFLSITQENSQPLVSIHMIHDNEPIHLNHTTITPTANHLRPIRTKGKHRHYITAARKGTNKLSCSHVPQTDVTIG